MHKFGSMIHRNIFSFAITFILILTQCSFAHQPRWVSENLTIVQNPEVSQAFYGILNGSPQYFEIDSSVPFNLYIGLTVPDLLDIKTDISADLIFYDEIGFKNTLFLKGQEWNWTPFYEEFGGDNYLQGPEIGFNASTGNYTIRIHSPSNTGKYTLAIGEKEEFPPNEIINTLILLPKLKSDFFNKSPFSAYFNRIGLMVFGPIIILVCLIIAFWAIRRILKDKKKKKQKKD